MAMVLDTSAFVAACAGTFAIENILVVRIKATIMKLINFFTKTSPSVCQISQIKMLLFYPCYLIFLPADVPLVAENIGDPQDKLLVIDRGILVLELERQVL